MSEMNQEPNLNEEEMGMDDDLIVFETEDGEEKVFERAGLALIRLAIHF